MASVHGKKKGDLGSNWFFQESNKNYYYAHLLRNVFLNRIGFFVPLIFVSQIQNYYNAFKSFFTHEPSFPLLFSVHSTLYMFVELRKELRFEAIIFNV